jgi:prephenate dehydrogenase
MIAPSRDAEVAIIGLGVIGGSVALRLRERGTAVRGFSTSVADRSEAQQAGIVVAPTLDDAVRGVGLVLIAVPLGAISIVADQVLGAAPAHTTILHAGSLQRAEALQALPEVAARLIGTHPLAGSHKSGFAGAHADLFREATVFVEQRANPQQRDDAEYFWSLAGARRIEYATANAHDEAMAWMSHLPQLASTALGATIAGAVERMPNEQVRPGPGARDATRLAMSSLDMWHPIFERAPAATIEALRMLEGNVRYLRVALEARDWPALREVWMHAHTWRTTLERGESA